MPGEVWATFAQLKETIDPENTYLGHGAAIFELFRRVEALNRRPDEPVVIVGPSGAGKTALAKLIHDSSVRGKKKFLSITADAVNGGDESVRRARFVGFGKNSGISGIKEPAEPSGWLRDYAGGTIFVDEMHDLDKASAGILRSIFDRREMSVAAGEGPSVATDVRLIFATYKTEAELEAADAPPHDFRRRLVGRYLAVPPIDDRQEDVPLFVKKYCGKCRWDESFLLALMRYDWKGRTAILIRAIEEAADRRKSTGGPVKRRKSTAGAVKRRKSTGERPLTVEDLRGGLVPDEVIDSVTDMDKGDVKREVVSG